MANIAQQVIVCIYMMAAKSYIIAGAKDYANNLPETGSGTEYDAMEAAAKAETDKAALDYKTTMKLEAGKLEAAGAWPIVFFGMVSVGLAYYFYSEAKQYDDMLDKYEEEFPELKRKAKDDNAYTNASNQ